MRVPKISERRSPFESSGHPLSRQTEATPRERGVAAVRQPRPQARFLDREKEINVRRRGERATRSDPKGNSQLSAEWTQTQLYKMPCFAWLAAQNTHFVSAEAREAAACGLRASWSAINWGCGRPRGAATPFLCAFGTFLPKGLDKYGAVWYNGNAELYGTYRNDAKPTPRPKL